MDKTEFLRQQLQVTTDWYKQSEDKAKFLVAINTSIVGVVNALVFATGANAKHAAGFLTGAVGVTVFLLGASLLASFACILRAVWARHRVLDRDLPNAERLWFFGYVAGLSRDQHRQEVANLTAESLGIHFENMLVSQSHILSTNVWRKHESLNWAIVFTVLSVVLLFLLGIAYSSLLAG